jgi:hypothetical protein
MLLLLLLGLLLSTESLPLLLGVLLPLLYGRCSSGMAASCVALLLPLLCTAGMCCMLLLPLLPAVLLLLLWPGCMLTATCCSCKVTQGTNTKRELTMHPAASVP